MKLLMIRNSELKPEALLVAERVNEFMVRKMIELLNLLPEYEKTAFIKVEEAFTDYIVEGERNKILCVYTLEDSSDEVVAQNVSSDIGEVIVRLLNRNQSRYADSSYILTTVEAKIYKKD